MLNLSRYNYYLQTFMDLVALILSFTVAIFTGLQIGLSINIEQYNQLLLFAIVAYLAVNIIFLANEDLLRKTFNDELRSVLKTFLIVFGALFVYIFATKHDPTYSRIFIGMYGILTILTCLLLRTLLRVWILPLFKNSKQAEKIVVVGEYEYVKKTIASMKQSDDWRFQLAGAVVVDRSGIKDTYIHGIKVVCDEKSGFNNIISEAADSYLLVFEAMDRRTMEAADWFIETGKMVHIRLGEADKLNYFNRTLDEMGGCAVISYHPIRTMSRRNAFIKRSLDILICLLGMPLYLIIWILSVFMTNIESRGHTPINYVRVGKNGRRFYQKRFRIMRMDASQRMKKGLSPFTVWGNFLRKTHLDGMPEIINIIQGDMSVVGPHTPRLSRYIEYSPERRKNLCVTPGVVGIWSTEKDEESIISRERDYIENWRISKDILILLEMFLNYITFHSLRGYSLKRRDEELQLIAQYKINKRPMNFNRAAYKAPAGVGYNIYLFIKRLLDIVLSIILIILASPFLIIISLAVMADDGGAPVYRHNRIGKNGKRIGVYKFRSMRQDAGDLEAILTKEQLEQYRREFKIEDDPRVTKIGEFIRKTSIDELPQLFNILKGELSFVGPRPVVQEETYFYGDDVAKFLSVTPGLTGYWQAYARNNATYETGQRQSMELYYVDHQSLWFDIKIFFRTFVSVIKKEGVK